MLEVIKKRRSIRSYQDKPVEKEKVEEILRAAMAAPSANHLRPWSFILVEDQSMLEKLSRATPWASFVAQAPVAIVVVADPASSKDWLEDGSIVAAHIYLEATNQGLGTCWVQLRRYQNDQGEEAEAYVKKLLKIPDPLRLVALLPLGYPRQWPAPHQGEIIKEKVHWEKWQNTNHD